LENALRRFKRKVQAEDIIKKVKRHSYYLKPGEKRRLVCPAFPRQFTVRRTLRCAQYCSKRSGMSYILSDPSPQIPMADVAARFGTELRLLKRYITLGQIPPAVNGKWTAAKALGVILVTMRKVRAGETGLATGKLEQWNINVKNAVSTPENRQAASIRATKMHAERKAKLAAAWRPDDWLDKPIEWRIIGTELLSQRDHMSNLEVAERLFTGRLVDLSC